MRVVGMMGCAFAIALAAGCGPTDLSESVPRRPPSTGGPSGRGAGGGFPGGEGGLDVGTFTEELVEADPAPLPIAGGTLAIIAQGTQAAVADPDNDQVVVIDLESMTHTATIPLAIGDDPGRLVEDAGGRLHIALRAGRGIAVVDPTAGVPSGRLPVCPLPRGLAYQYDTDTVHVACAGGELVSYTASSGKVVRKLKLERDLRDVVVDGGRLLVSRFRAAELLVVEADGTISARLSPAFGPSAMKPAVAWRTMSAPGGGALMVHQIMLAAPIDTGGGGYGGQCRQIVTTAVTLLRTDGSGWWVDSIPTVLPVDIAATEDGSRVAVPSAARTSYLPFSGKMPFVVFTPPALNTRVSLSPCGGGFSMPPFVGGQPEPQGRVVAVAFDPSGRLALQTRAPNMFHLGSRSVPLPGRTRKHTGHEIFHLATAGGIACASCHPEGRDDGQVWNFANLGPRRTQSLAGGIAGTEPLHWAGDMSNFDMLAFDVFLSRMSGPKIEPVHAASLKKWVDTIPRLEAPGNGDVGAVARGQGLFNEPSLGCATCHSGPRLTNNQTLDVNTGAGPFQVPSLLGIAWRAPYMHQGCAATLEDRFGPCGGGDRHGQTSKLTVAQRSDLIAYLETL